jgi:hypothetical protein
MVCCKGHLCRKPKKLAFSLYQLQVRYKLLQYENDGLKEALNAKKQHKKKSKQLNL